MPAVIHRFNLFIFQVFSIFCSCFGLSLFIAEVSTMFCCNKCSQILWFFDIFLCVLFFCLKRCLFVRLLHISFEYEDWNLQYLKIIFKISWVAVTKLSLQKLVFYRFCFFFITSDFVCHEKSLFATSFSSCR